MVWPRVMWCTLAAVMCGLLLAAAPRAAAPPCNVHPLIPSLLPDCEEGPPLHAKARTNDGDQTGVEALAEREAERRRVWRALPVPVSASPSAEFGQAESEWLAYLAGRDLWFLMKTVPTGMDGNMTNWLKLFEDLVPGRATTPTTLESAFMNFDIPLAARPLFVEWVNSIRRGNGRTSDNGMTTPMLWYTAAREDRSNYRRAYEHARNWNEFAASGLDMSKYLTPELYLRKQMERDVSLQLERPHPATLPDTFAATKSLYDLFVRMFGQEHVEAAAGKVLRLRKNADGVLAEPAEIEVGTYRPMPNLNPYMAFLTEVTHSSPHNYAIALCFDQYALLGGSASESLITSKKWSEAFDSFGQVVAKFGADATESAARRIQQAPKDGQGLLLGDSQSRSMVAWFQALLTDPKAALPDSATAAAAIQSAGAYDAAWMGRKMVVHGTVSRVVVSPPVNTTQWVTIFLRESPDDTFVFCSLYPDLFESATSRDPSWMVGKSIEVTGLVERPYCSGKVASIRVEESKQFRVR